MTKKDYELIAKWVKDYTYVVEIRLPEEPTKVYEEFRIYRGAFQALAIRLQKANSKFSPVKFAEMCGYDVQQLDI